MLGGRIDLLTCLVRAIGRSDAGARFLDRSSLMRTVAELATSRWWRRCQAEKGIRGSCCTTAITIRALTVVNVSSDNCMEESLVAIELWMTTRKGTWQTGMGEAYVSRVGWSVIYCGRRMQQAL
jgi:hypothetical protein